MSFSWAQYAPRGRQAAVYYRPVFSSPLGCEVWLKQMAFSSISEALEAAAEVAKLVSTSHSSIDPVLDYDLDGRTLLSVVTAKKGEVTGTKNLEMEINKRRRTHEAVSEGDMWQWLRSLVSALSSLQELVIFIKGISHRNIKPQCILLSPSGNVEISNFAYTRRLRLSIGKSTIDQCESPLIRAALVRGEMDERKVAHNVYKSDVFSLGVVFLCLMLLDTPPFLSDPRLSQVNLDREIREVQGYSELWKGVVRRMLAVEEAERPDFCELQGLINSIGGCYFWH